jgi:uncharacterized protein
MRLNQSEKKWIVTLAKKHFGINTHVFLFGSRVYDDKRGGDIDLFIQNDNEKELSLLKKVHFLAEVKKRIGDQKIDTVFDNSNTRSKVSFYQSIREQMIEIVPDSFNLDPI